VKQKKLEIILNNLVETNGLGDKLGRNLIGGEVIELSGDLGSGKTTLVKGIVAGTGSEEHVSSPTFVVSKEYKSPNFTIHHYDLYRLDDEGLIANELSDHYIEDSSVTIIEWGANFIDVLPEKRVIISISPIDENSRKVKIIYPENLEYLMDGIVA